MVLKKLSTKNLLFVTLIFCSLVLRLLYLGYSDYISDEPGTFFYRGGKKDPHMSKREFMLSQRKGPLQLIFGYIPYSIVGNYNNEFAQRLPFSIMNLLSVIVLYFLLIKVTNNHLIAFFGSFLFCVNGLVTAYGRIAQYQNLNFFFSLTSLYFFYDLVDKKEGLLRSSLVGTLLLSLSFLAHWYASLFLIPIFYLVTRFLLNKNFSVQYKVALVFLNVLLVCAITLPFMIPYLNYMKSQAPRNTTYASRTLGFSGEWFRTSDLKQFKLYNPFLTLYVYLFFGAVGLLVSIKKYPMFSIWIGGVALFFMFFVKYSGLHFYNLFFPLIILVAFGIEFFINKFSGTRKKIFAGMIAFLLFFLFAQTYIIFVDHKKEYPWERENIFGFKTPKYTHKDEFRHKTGFPHKRYWDQINEFINKQNLENGEDFGYTTNEYPQIAKYYMKAEFRSADGFYAVGIKRPNSFATDYKFPQIKNKHTVLKIKNEYDTTVVRIYRVEDD